jgi:hypothetical protein
MMVVIIGLNDLKYMFHATNTNIFGISNIGISHT